MAKKKWLYIACAALLVFSVVFLSLNFVFGIPLWWMAPKQLSMMNTNYVNIQVLPDTPKTFGEMVTVTVTNSTDQTPIAEVQVLVMPQGMSTVTLTTNSTGEASFSYTDQIAEVQVSQSAPDGTSFSAMFAVPSRPTAWVNGRYEAWGLAAFSCGLTTFLAWLIPPRKVKIKRRKK
jgi:hypothetical protein